MKVVGTFDVKLNPLDISASGQDGVLLGRMSIEKTFYGELDATSQGEMLSAMTSTAGSAGYVAIEQVDGSLCGKRGSFTLQHFGIMDRGKDRLVLEVIPDSASGELAGLTGRMSLHREGTQHLFEFDYDLP